MLLTAGLGLLVGIPLGVVIERGDFCMHSAFRQIFERRQTSSLPAYLLALGCQLVLVNALSGSQILFVPVPPLTWVAAIVGGVIFGFGMVGLGAERPPSGLGSGPEIWRQGLRFWGLHSGGC